MLPVGKDIVLVIKSGFLSNSGHKREVAIETFDESNCGVILPLFLY